MRRRAGKIPRDMALLEFVQGERPIGTNVGANVQSMMPRALVVFLFLGCASAQDTAPLSEDVADDEDAALEQDHACVREATVTVRVENQSSMDLQITFGSYRAARAAEGFSRTTYNIPRVYLQDYVRIQILRGGLQTGPAPLIPTEPVFCNIATLVIGAQPSYSIFYGDELKEPARKSRTEEEEAEEAPADSSASEAEGEGTVDGASRLR